MCQNVRPAFQYCCQSIPLYWGGWVGEKDPQERSRHQGNPCVQLDSRNQREHSHSTHETHWYLQHIAIIHSHYSRLPSFQFNCKFLCLFCYLQQQKTYRNLHFSPLFIIYPPFYTQLYSFIYLLKVPNM